MTNKKHQQDLANRTMVNGISAILIALFIFLARLPLFRSVFAGAVAAVAAVALWEYFQILKKKGILPATWIGIPAVILYVFATFFKTQFETFWPAGDQFILWGTVFCLFVFFAFRGDSPIINISSSFFGIAYIGIPLSLIINIMYSPKWNAFEGSWWVIYLIAVTKSADIGGYFIGRFFGKRKLASWLSPNKTLEGALGGLLASILISVLIYSLGRTFWHVFANITLVQALYLGALIGVLGQLGDLAESLLKRDAKVKDSNSLPGVGGILDMIDSLLFTTPLLFLFVI